MKQAMNNNICTLRDVYISNGRREHVLKPEIVCNEVVHQQITLRFQDEMMHFWGMDKMIGSRLGSLG